MKRLIFITGLALGLFPLIVWAQSETPTPPGNPLIPLVHTVQEGENLTVIAAIHEVTVEELMAINNLNNADVLAVGQQLVIPGGEGDAVATVYMVQAGDTVAQVAALFNTTPAEVRAANGLLNRGYQPYMGQALTVVSHTGSSLAQPVRGTPHIVAAGESLLSIAARHGRAPVEIAAANELAYPYYLFPGQRLRIPGEATYQELPGEWVVVRVRPLPIQQGSTLSIYVQNLLDGEPTGSFAGQPLRFFAYEEGFVALVGIDAFMAPGMATLQLSGSGTLPWRPFTQDVPVADAGFGVQPVPVPEELAPLLDPQIRAGEDNFLATFYNQSSSAKAWDGLFHYPVTATVVTGGYGDGRSYNGGPVEGYHTGIDFAGGLGTPILAPANGAVVFADLLELRGNTVILDHGLGVMTAYFHLSEIFVAPGDQTTTGQMIGAGGSTGLSTGPHLHWDVRVNGVPVNGLQWVEHVFP